MKTTRKARWLAAAVMAVTLPAVMAATLPADAADDTTTTDSLTPWRYDAGKPIPTRDGMPVVTFDYHTWGIAGGQTLAEETAAYVVPGVDNLLVNEHYIDDRGCEETTGWSLDIDHPDMAVALLNRADGDQVISFDGDSGTTITDTSKPLFYIGLRAVTQCPATSEHGASTSYGSFPDIPVFAVTAEQAAAFKGAVTPEENAAVAAACLAAEQRLAAARDRFNTLAAQRDRAKAVAQKKERKAHAQVRRARKALKQARAMHASKAVARRLKARLTRAEAHAAHVHRSQTRKLRALNDRVGDAAMEAFSLPADVTQACNG